eukprot:366322-Chlamydomonas_euryale.AAC.6
MRPLFDRRSGQPKLSPLGRATKAAAARLDDTTKVVLPSVNEVVTAPHPLAKRICMSADCTPSPGQAHLYVR